MSDSWFARVMRPSELHRSERSSTTARAVTLWRALEARRPPGQRIVDDPYAELFLSPAARSLLGPLRVAQPIRDLAARRELTGVSTYVLCRHRLIDDALATALADGVDQVIVLGAGYDSRAYRFADRLAGRPVFEVDLPPLSRAKAALVASRPDRFGSVPVHRVEIDFRTQSLADRLAASAFVPGAATFVVWEGVAPYLDEKAVLTTLRTLRELCGGGSTLALDLWDGVGGSGPLAPVRRLGARALGLIGEPVTFGVAPSAAPALLAEHGFEVVDVADARALTERYATAGRRCTESLYVVVAERASHMS